MKYKTYTIERSGFNFRVRDPRGSYLAEIAATAATAKRWIDCLIEERRIPKVHPAASDETILAVARKAGVAGVIINRGI